MASLGSYRLSPLTLLITSLTSTSFLLFGYDQGLMSGILLSPSWSRAMGDPTSFLLGTITALHALGALAGAIVAAFIGDYLGRRRTLLSGAGLVLLGGIGMTCASGRGVFMLARTTAGAGVGFVCSVAPVYQAEIAETTQRGWLVCCQLTTMLVGLWLAYAVNYTFYFYPGEMQWRVPVGLQVVFASYVLLGGIWAPDTPRWLLKKGLKKEGRAVLAQLRAREVDDEGVNEEAEKIERAVVTEAQVQGTWRDLFKDNGIMANKRFYLAVGIQFMQQCTGINIVTYYAPTLFKTSLGLDEESALLLGCFTQLWYVLASFVTWYTIDRVGRRKLFISMALGMCLVLIGEAVCVGINTPAASIVAIVFLFLFEACFTWGWMACVWIYPPEILPLSIRAKGSALAAAADFLGNFVVVEVTPVGIEKMGAWFYVVWAVLNLANALLVWLFYPETGGLALEAVDSVFTRDVNEGLLDNPGATTAHTTAVRGLQWSRVRVAAEMVEESRASRKRETWIAESEGALLGGNDREDYGTVH